MSVSAPGLFGAMFVTGILMWVVGFSQGFDYAVQKVLEEAEAE